MAKPIDDVIAPKGQPPEGAKTQRAARRVYIGPLGLLYILPRFSVLCASLGKAKDRPCRYNTLYALRGPFGARAHIYIFRPLSRIGFQLPSGLRAESSPALRGMRSPLRGAHKTNMLSPFGRRSAYCTFRCWKPKGGWCSLPLRGKLSDKEARRGPEGATPFRQKSLKVGVASSRAPKGPRRAYKVPFAFRQRSQDIGNICPKGTTWEILSDKKAGPKGGPQGPKGLVSLPLRGKLSDKEARRGPEGATKHQPSFSCPTGPKGKRALAPKALWAPFGPPPTLFSST